MKVIVCPHCGKKRSTAVKAGRDAVSFLLCPACQEWIVIFADCVVAVDREIIQHGSFRERKEHIAEIVAEFLEAGLLPDFRRKADPAKTEDLEELFDQEEAHHAPISDREFQRFLEVDLRRIDEATYFKRHFESS